MAEQTSRDIIIIGSGACGLMAALDLAKSGKKVVILEARSRIGGRIWPLSESDYKFPAQAGAEFIHGPAPVLKSLAKEAGLTYIPMSSDGETWNFRNGQAIKVDGSITEDPELALFQKEINEKLVALKQDKPVGDFLEKFFPDDKYIGLRDWVIRKAKSYDAADPARISTFALRDEWLGGTEWEQGKLQEGFGALINYLHETCLQHKVDILINQEVKSVKRNHSGVEVETASGEVYVGKQVLITVPLPVIKTIDFQPSLPEKKAAAEKIGYGQVIKILMQFKNQWWLNALGQNFTKLSFMLTDGPVSVWWTQYPIQLPVIVGWMPGLPSEHLEMKSEQEILETCISQLSGMFKVDKVLVRENLVRSTIVNWPADPYSQGAYSYPTPETEKARLELTTPIGGKIFFAGEALYSGNYTATVEGALDSAKEAVIQILS